MYLLDIGGGFPGSEDVKLKFEEVILCPNCLSMKINGLVGCI